MAGPSDPLQESTPDSADPTPTVVEQSETPGVDRTTDRRMARLHLRTGARALARVELESLAGLGGLDDEALLDLAEVRWRTDDLTGAGEAAAAYLASGREAPLALVIVAEATAALGRPSEARRLADRAVELIDGPLDAIFAGMPRRAVWPVQPVETVEVPGPAAAAVDQLGAGSPAVDRLAAGTRDATDPTLGFVAADRARPPGEPPHAAGIGVLGASAARADPGADLSTPARPIDPVGPSADAGAMPDPGAELAAARAALSAGDRDEAAIRLAVVLRLAPSLAPAVLDIAAAEPGPGFDLVRGDALRLVGRESQARRSFAAAARGSTLAEPRPTGDQTADREPEPDG